MNSHTVRRSFIDFFVEKCDHTEVPSSPVIPHNDPSLLFINAGMNQFKDVFLGRGTRPWTKIANSQKCIRAGGKHNDLEDVGKDTWHHTFFEMLGNWSFGDYFKEEAIQWSWELLTQKWGLDPNRLHVTVFAGNSDENLKADHETLEIWKSIDELKKENITLHGKKDNFWEMGATGPCGPCSEIHYDATLNASGRELVNQDHPLVIELWNLVFIQFNRTENNNLETLPSQHIDTGMGLERAVRTLQKKNSNYDTDLFTSIFESISNITKTPSYKGSLENPTDIAYRIIADHLRCLSIAIADGALPGNEGKNYVLRRILRRASRMAFQVLNQKNPVIYKLVPSLCDTLGQAFPELNYEQKNIEKAIFNEEEIFLRTLDRGLSLFEETTKNAYKNNNLIGGKEAFVLHDTYGFPIDLTSLMAKEKDLKVNKEEYERHMNKAREKSRKNIQRDHSFSLDPNALKKLKEIGARPTNDSNRDDFSKTTHEKLIAIWKEGCWSNSTVGENTATLIFNSTNFYAESGGQIGDQGAIKTETSCFKVTSTQQIGDYILHQGILEKGSLQTGETCVLSPNEENRNLIRKNHTATHLLNHALKQVLGDHIEQRGSLVDNNKLRFDFTHPEPVTKDQLAEIENLVLNTINNSLDINQDLIPLNEGLSINGIRAVFGEKYPDPVRVISIGPKINTIIKDKENPQWQNRSIEFCGGSHVENTTEINHFSIISESGLAAGVRRITAITGMASNESKLLGEKYLEELQNNSTNDDNDSFILKIQKNTEENQIPLLTKYKINEQIFIIRKKIKQEEKEKLKKESATANDVARKILNSINSKDLFIISTIGTAGPQSLLAALDTIKNAHPNLAIMLASTDPHEKKIHLACQVPKCLVSKGLQAGAWMKETASACDGQGGGRNESARGGGKNIKKLSTALKVATIFAKELTK